MTWKTLLTQTVTAPWEAGNLGESEALVRTLRLLAPDNIDQVIGALPPALRAALLEWWAHERVAREQEPVIALGRGMTEEPPPAALEALRRGTNRWHSAAGSSRVHLPARGERSPSKNPFTPLAEARHSKSAPTRTAQ